QGFLSAALQGGQELKALVLRRSRALQSIQKIPQIFLIKNVCAMKEKVLGVLGGVGPLATIYFADLVIKMTDAKTDQEHIAMVILNHASIPDRTEYILDNTKTNPLPVMIADAKLLQKYGSDYFVIP